MQKAQQTSTDLHVRGVLWGIAAIAISAMLAALASYLLWQWWHAPPGPNTRTAPAIENPTLQSAPQTERARYYAEKDRLLASWEWIDRQHGIARIPVEEAMRIMAARGKTESR